MAVVREQESAEAIVPGVTSRKTAPDGLTTREGLNLAGRHDHRWSCPGAMRPNAELRAAIVVAEKECCVIPQGLPGTPMAIGDPHVRWCGSREGRLSRRPDLSLGRLSPEGIGGFPHLGDQSVICFVEDRRCDLAKLQQISALNKAD